MWWPMPEEEEPLVGDDDDLAPPEDFCYAEDEAWRRATSDGLPSSTTVEATQGPENPAGTTPSREAGAGSSRNSDDFEGKTPLDALGTWVEAWVLWDPETGKVLSPLEHDKEFLDSWREHHGEDKAAMARAIEVRLELEPISASWDDEDPSTEKESSQ